MMGPIVAGLLGIGGNILGQQHSNNQQLFGNLGLAAYQNWQNKKLLRWQLNYDKPINQRKRMEEAGFNPNLFYGQGSPGNQGQPLKFPDVQMPRDTGMLASLGSQFMQMKLMQSQANLTDTKVQESTVKQDLMRAQTAVANANPYLNKSYLDAMVLQLQSVASVKEAEAKWFIGENNWTFDGKPMHGPAGALKMETELQILLKKYDLFNADQKIKAEILESKGFQNDLLEVQSKWMKDAEITPEHIRQFIMMLLTRFK